MGCVKSYNRQEISIRTMPQPKIKYNFRRDIRTSIYRFIDLDLSKNLLYAKRIQQHERKNQIEVPLLPLRNDSDLVHEATILINQDKNLLI